MAATPNADAREFLASRRARITPQQAGLPAYGGNRRVPGLRREEVAMLSGVSVDYYVRLERGNLAGVSQEVLDAIATTLRLDDAERQYLHDLAQAAGPGRRRAPRRRGEVQPAIRQMLDAVTGAPAWVRNARHDIVAANALGRALYAPSSPDPDAPRTPCATPSWIRARRSSGATTTRSRTTPPPCCAWRRPATPTTPT